MFPFPLLQHNCIHSPLPTRLIPSTHTIHHVHPHVYTYSPVHASSSSHARQIVQPSQRLRVSSFACEIEPHSGLEKFLSHLSRPPRFNSVKFGIFGTNLGIFLIHSSEFKFQVGRFHTKILRKSTLFPLFLALNFLLYIYGSLLLC